jgi:hypothetical protein
MKRSFLTGGFLCRASGGLLVAVLLSSVWGANLKSQLSLIPGVENYQLLVKFSSATAPDVDSVGKLLFRRRAPLTKSSAQQNALGLKYRRAVHFTADETRRIQLGEAASAKPTSRGQFDILGFSGLLYVNAPGLDKNGLLALGQELEALDDVEYCSLEPLQGPPPPDPFDVPSQANHDAAPITPLYTDQQGWLGPNPGVDCRYGWTVGADGYSVTVRDIEDSWGSLKHEDFPWDSLAYVLPAYTHTYDDHGMGIFGMIFGQHNDYGIDGCAPRAKGRAYSFQTSATAQNRPNAMTRMVTDAVVGDIILLEMQTSGADGKLAPADYTTAIWDLTKQATDKGVVVIGTAGNGGANLDSSVYAAYRNRGDNGVVMEGAGTSTTAHTKLDFLWPLLRACTGLGSKRGHRRIWDVVQPIQRFHAALLQQLQRHEFGRGHAGRSGGEHTVLCQKESGPPVDVTGNAEFAGLHGHSPGRGQPHASHWSVAQHPCRIEQAYNDHRLGGATGPQQHPMAVEPQGFGGRDF